MCIRDSYHGAVDMFRQASVLEEPEAAFKERLGIALYYDKQYAEAVDVLVKLVAREGYGQRVDLLTALGECQLNTAKARDARGTFETATQQDPASVKAWLGLGRAAMEMKDFRRAELALKKAQSLDAKSADAHLM